MSWPRTRTALIGVLILTTLAGCAGESSSTSSGGGLPQDPVYDPPVSTPAPQPEENLHATAPEDCVDPNYPTPLTVRAETADEIATLADIAACTSTDGTSVYLHNSSDLVWRIYTDTGGETVEHSDRTPAQLALQQAAPDVAMMEPDSAVALVADPSVVHWYADPALTAVHGTIALLEEQLIAQAVENAPDLLRRSTRARAHATCAVAAYQVADAVAEARKADSVEDRTAAVAEGAQSVLTSAGECRTQLQQADAADVAAGRISRPVVPVLRATPAEVKVRVVAKPVRLSWGVALRNLVRVWP